MLKKCKKFIKIHLLFCITIYSCYTSNVYAKDLFVSPSGNDSISYGDNSIDHPWQSPQTAWKNALAGDTVYFRGGTYQISETIDTHALKSANGTAENPITFMNYNNEYVLFKSALTDVFRIERNYNYIKGINGEGGGTFWHIASNRTAEHFKMTNCTGKTIKPGGSSNYGFVVFQSKRANYGIVENCIFKGPGSNLNQNTAGIFIFRSQGIKIKNNEFTGFPRAIYYKHTCINSDTGIIFSGNYFHGNGDGIVSSGNYIQIENNLLVGDQILIGQGGGLGDDGTNNGGDNNIIRHNTIYNSTINLLYVSDGDGSGCKNNIIKDNVIMSKLSLHKYSDVPHYTFLDHNIYPTGVIITENRINYYLIEWQNHNGSDTKSISAVPIFRGGNSPQNIQDFALSENSVAKGKASDGKDIGIDVSSVGPKLTQTNTALSTQSSNSGVQIITPNTYLPPPPQNIKIIN